MELPIWQIPKWGTPFMGDSHMADSHMANPHMADPHMADSHMADASSVRLARRYKRAPPRSAALHYNSPRTGSLRTRRVRARDDVRSMQCADEHNCGSTENRCATQPGRRGETLALFERDLWGFGGLRNTKGQKLGARGWWARHAGAGSRPPCCSTRGARARQKRSTTHQTPTRARADCARARRRSGRWVRDESARACLAR